MITRYLPYRIQLNAPALLTTISPDPNSAVSSLYVPGSAIRGAVANAILHSGRPDAEQEMRLLILNGGVRYLNAYPASDSHRTLPTPLYLRGRKHAADGDTLSAPNLSAFHGRPGPEFDPVSLEDEGTWPDSELERVREPFVAIDAAKPRFAKVALSSRVHQQRDRTKGRAWRERHGHQEIAHGAIFTYEFLDACQQFVGLIQVDGDSEAEAAHLLDRVRKRLAGTVLLGRSRKARYGGAAAVEFPSQARKRELSGTGVFNRDVTKGDEILALLTAPCILRDRKTGQIDPAALLRQLPELLNDRVEIVRVRWAFELTGGFNRKWRLSLPQALAIAPGSAVLLRARQEIPKGDLLRIEHGAMGERRIEGFGRIVFLEPPAKVVHVYRSKPRPEPPRPRGEPPEQVTEIERCIMQAALLRAADRRAVEMTRQTRPPSGSLVGRLRNVMRRDPQDALLTLAQWLGSDEPSALKRPAMDQLRRCRLIDVDGQPTLADWLRQYASEEGHTAVLRELGATDLAQRLHIVSRDSALQALENLTMAARAGLIDGVLAALRRKASAMPPRSQHERR